MENNRFFLVKILDVLKSRIKAKVILFETFIILFVALSIGVVVNFYMERTLTEKAHHFSERIVKDLAKAVENNYISISAVDDAVKSFNGTEGILYLGYHGRIVSAANDKPAAAAPVKKPARRTTAKTRAKPVATPAPVPISGEVKRVHLFIGQQLNDPDLEQMEASYKGLTNFKIRPSLVNFVVNGMKTPAFEYYMPVQVRVLDDSRKIGTIVLRYSQLVIQRDIERVRLLIAIIAAVIIVIGIFLSIRGANTIVMPIVMLTRAVQRFGSGDMNVRTQLQVRDEIGVLARSFDDMIVSVKEKLEMQKFVSDSTVKMIKKSVNENQTGSMKEKETERKEVTLFFSDIRGFTSMSEKMDPQEVVHILNEYLDVQSNVIRNFNGDIDKFVGDEIVAVFESATMAQDAVNAAREAQQKVAELNRKRVEKGLNPVEVGIGINTGEVVMGSIGSHDRLDFTVIGDNVNLAARLCSAAGRGEVIISNSVYALLSKEERKGMTRLEPISVKGKVKPIEIYRADY